MDLGQHGGVLSRLNSGFDKFILFYLLASIFNYFHINVNKKPFYGAEFPPFVCL
jgi:hypothetical protein